MMTRNVFRAALLAVVLTAGALSPVAIQSGAPAFASAQAFVVGPAFYSATTFVPTDITGLQLWLDASDAASITESGVPDHAVSQWNDKSGNARHITQGTAADEPHYVSAAQNGLNVVSLNGSNEVMQNTSAAMLRNVAGWTVFIVCKPTTNTPATQMNLLYVRADSGSGAARASAHIAQTTGFWAGGGRRSNGDAFGAVASSTQASTSAYSLFVVIGDYTNTDAFVRRNGSQIASNTSWLTSGSTPNDEGALIVGNTATGVAPFGGRVAEIIAYSSALSSTNYGLVESYLTSKWGLMMSPFGLAWWPWRRKRAANDAVYEDPYEFLRAA